MVSSNASLSYAEIAAAASSSQTLFFQLYKHKDDAIALKRIQEVERLGYKAIFLTVDAIVPGNRERDIKSPWFLDDQENGIKVYNDGEGAADTDSGLGTAGALIVNDDRDMTWERVCIKIRICSTVF
jgi:L-lactate dehydrogenase (cytochrome)